MRTEEIELIKRFKSIARKRWIKNTAKGWGGIGLTFEHELGKKDDAMYFPDFYDIEIKCSGRYSRYPVFLFTAAFDGPTFPEINRIVDLYGTPDIDYPDKKILFLKLKTKEKNIHNDFKFKLDIDDNEEKIFLCVYDLDDNLIERKSFIYFDTLYNHLNLKLKTMAYIKASIKNIENEKHFRYYSITLYKLKSFNVFLNLLRNDEIDVDLIARIGKSKRKKKSENKNLVFKIKKEKLSMLFIKTFEYDLDNGRYTYYNKLY